MTKAMQCNGGIYRVEHEDGTVYIYDNYNELTEHYNILGVLTPSFGLTFVVSPKE
jgi:hypothetical protein